MGLKFRLTGTQQDIKRDGTDFVDYDVNTGQPVHGGSTRQLSVRESEALAARLLRSPAAGRRKQRTDRDLERLQEEASQRLGTTVQIRPGRKGSGTIVLSYSGLDHLDQLLKKLR